MEQAELRYDRRLVAFIDILGFREIVKQSESDSKKIELLYSVLHYFKDWEAPERWDLRFVEIEEDAQKRGIKNFDIKGKTNCTSFSDSIVISVSITNNVNEMATSLIVNLAYIGAILLEQGILIRGGLTIGNIIHRDNGIVLGQGLIDAYTLESKNAKYPRIIMSNALISELNYPLETKRNRFPYHQYVVRFDDGCVGFHQMMYYQVVESWTEMTEEMLKDSLSNIRNTIIAGLDTSFENPDTFEKYKWLKEQYNDLIILCDYDFDTKLEGKIKKKISRKTSEQNIHYRYNNRN